MHDRNKQTTRESSESHEFRLSQRHLLLLGLIVVVVLSLVYLWQSWRWISAYNDLQAAEAKLESLEAERQHVRFQVERAFSLERIEHIATERIAADQGGMTHPQPGYLDLSGSDGDQP